MSNIWLLNMFEEKPVLFTDRDVLSLIAKDPTTTHNIWILLGSNNKPFQSTHRTDMPNCNKDIIFIYLCFLLEWCTLSCTMVY